MDIIGDYFSPHYEQTTANEKIDYSGLVDYIKALMEDAQRPSYMDFLSYSDLSFEETIHVGKRRSFDIFFRLQRGSV